MSEVFISYVQEDRSQVEMLREQLEAFDVPVWLDKYELKPGVRWKDAIRKAIGTGNFFIACFSEAYINRSKTYMNEELTLAIEELRLRPSNQSWFLPVKLSNCEIPDRNIGAGETLKSFQWVDLWRDWNKGFESLLSVIRPDYDKIQKLISQLESNSRRERFRAIDSLEKMGPLAVKAVHKVVEYINNFEDDEITVMNAVSVLGNVGSTDKEILEILERISLRGGYQGHAARLTLEKLRGIDH
jgi:hypothetical protein